MRTTAVATLLCVYARDDARHLDQALRSVVQQELPRGVVSRLYVGVDGPITAELEAALHAHADRIHLLYRSPANRGLAATLNALIERLGDETFVFRMDADDVSLPGRYAAQLEFLDDHPEVDIVGTAITELDEATERTREVRFCKGPDDAVANIHRRVPVAHPTVCFRRRVLNELRGYPTAGTNEDIALWFECIRRGFAFGNLPQSLLLFRVSPQFWRRRGLGKARSELLCYWRGIRAMHGLATPKYAYPFARFLMRLAPVWVSRMLYRSPWRSAG